MSTLRVLPSIFAIVCSLLRIAVSLAGFPLTPGSRTLTKQPSSIATGN